MSWEGRVAGVLVGGAAGDALGAPYEFGPPVDRFEPMIAGGRFDWEPGEWTDDTQMAICIAEVAAAGSLDPAKVGERFIAWAGEAKDVGIQTRQVLSASESGADLARAAADYHRRHPDNSAGNGSLMRTGPVALAYLGDREGIAQAATEISALTHADPQCGDACVLWCLAIDTAVATGTIPDLHHGLAYVPEPRRHRWGGIIDAAETRKPETFTPNGYGVTALQAAWSSIIHTPIPQNQPSQHLVAALNQTVRIGGDTDTVAAIAGSLLGAIWGAHAVPETWRAVLHGWPGYTTDHLVRLAAAITQQ